MYVYIYTQYIFFPRNICSHFLQFQLLHKPKAAIQGVPKLGGKSRTISVTECFWLVCKLEACTSFFQCRKKIFKVYVLNLGLINFHWCTLKPNFTTKEN